MVPAVSVCQAGPTTHTPVPPSGMSVEDDTLFLLEAAGGKRSLADQTGRLGVVVHGGTRLGDLFERGYLRFGSGFGNVIAVRDGGKVDFTGGFTLEAWIYLEDDKGSGPEGVFASKQGTFSFSIRDLMLNNDWVSFPKDRVATTSLLHPKDYPVDNQAFFGATRIPAKRWVHLAVTYDEPMQVIRTWVDGGLDRTRYLSLQSGASLLSDPDKDLEFLKGMKNVRVAGPLAVALYELR